MRLILLAALGCGASSAMVGPEPVVREYAAAVRGGDGDALHALMDERGQSSVSREDLGQMLEDNQAELGERAAQLETQLDGGLESRATVRLPGGELAVLALEDGEWKIVGGVLDAPALQTPEDAVRSLRRALRRRNLAGVLRVLARAPRSQIEAEIDRFLEDTEDDLDIDAEIQGNEAVVHLANQRTIRLVREAGEWRILEVE